MKIDYLLICPIRLIGESIYIPEWQVLQVIARWLSELSSVGEPVYGNSLADITGQTTCIAAVGAIRILIGALWQRCHLLLSSR